MKILFRYSPSEGNGDISIFVIDRCTKVLDICQTRDKEDYVGVSELCLDAS